MTSVMQTRSETYTYFSRGFQNLFFFTIERKNAIEIGFYINTEVNKILVHMIKKSNFTYRTNFLPLLF